MNDICEKIIIKKEGVTLVEFSNSTLLSCQEVATLTHLESSQLIRLRCVPNA